MFSLDFLIGVCTLEPDDLKELEDDDNDKEDDDVDNAKDDVEDDKAFAFVDVVVVVVVVIVVAVDDDVVVEDDDDEDVEDDETTIGGGTPIVNEGIWLVLLSEGLGSIGNSDDIAAEVSVALAGGFGPFATFFALPPTLPLPPVDSTDVVVPDFAVAAFDTVALLILFAALLLGLTIAGLLFPFELVSCGCDCCDSSCDGVGGGCFDG